MIMSEVPNTNMLKFQNAMKYARHNLWFILPTSSHLEFFGTKTPKLSGKVHLTVNQTNNFVYPWFFYASSWCFQACFLPSVCYLRDIGCCKVIIFSQIRLDWYVPCPSWSTVFFRDTGNVSGSLPIPWRSQLQGGNELESSRYPAHEQYFAFQWQRQ